MVNPVVLEERVKYQKFLEERWVLALERFMARHGDFEKVGQTDECLKLQEFYDYTDNRVRKATRERYEAHFQQCSDCAKIVPQLQEYQSQRRSSRKMAVLSREALALCCRIKDYLYA